VSMKPRFNDQIFGAKFHDKLSRTYS